MAPLHFTRPRCRYFVRRAYDAGQIETMTCDSVLNEYMQPEDEEWAIKPSLSQRSLRLRHAFERVERRSLPVVGVTIVASSTAVPFINAAEM